MSESIISIRIKWLRERAAIGESSLFTRMRKNGIKSLENDLFEYEMRIKNIDDENSAILLDETD